MLAAADSSFAPFTIVFFATFLCIAVARAVHKAVRRGARMMRDSIVARDGHAALSDEARASLEKRGMNVEKMERLVEKTYRVNARGEIVLGGESTETGSPSPPTSSTVPATAEPDRPLYRKPSVEDLLRGSSGK
jgi:hypothetical protein